MSQTFDSMIAGFRNSTHQGFLVADLEKNLRRIFPDITKWRGRIRFVVDDETELPAVKATINLFVGQDPTVNITPEGQIVVSSIGFDALNAGKV